MDKLSPKLCNTTVCIISDVVSYLLHVEIVYFLQLKSVGLPGVLEAPSLPLLLLLLLLAEEYVQLHVAPAVGAPFPT